MNWFQKVAASIGTFFSGTAKAVSADVTDVDKVLQSATNIALNAANALKDFATTPAGQTIEAVLGAVVPVQWINGFINVLPTIITDLQWAKNELDKTPRQLITEGLTTAVNAAPNAKSTMMASLQAHAAVHFAAQQGVDLPIQAALSQAHVVYMGLPLPPVA